MSVTPDQATAELRKGNIVAIPTETVYGLAAAINSEVALKKIFEVKQRPFFDPLIVHVESAAQAKTLTIEWPEIAEALTQKFWPGPLTLVLKKNEKISNLITSGLERVGLRCPSHPVALEILRKVKIPLAAPSANLFGRTSPTSAAHVVSEFGNSVPVVDGGSSDIGIESTVLLIDGTEIALLRLGHILASDIEKYLQKLNIRFSWKSQITKTESPGHMKHHYMPAKPLFWVEGGKHPDLLSQMNIQLQLLPNEVEGVTITKPQKIQNVDELKLPLIPSEAARMLYAELRRLGEGSADSIVFYYQDYMSSQEWAPILERLKKASSAVIKN